MAVISPNLKIEPVISTPAYFTANPRGISAGRKLVDKPITG